MPGWQEVYQELKDEGFEIIAVAEDTGGEAVAGPFYEAAKATYTTLIDVHHHLSSLYNMVNVPTGVWINEEGTIVRHDEDAYSERHQLGTIQFGNDVYRPAVYDWVQNGEKSPYVQSPEEVLARIPRRTGEKALAEPNFKLGVYFHLQGDEPRAKKYWEKAQSLNPESWNYHRQDWSFLPSQAETMQRFLGKVRGLEGKPYYRPLDFPEVPAEE